MSQKNRKKKPFTVYLTPKEEGLVRKKASKSGLDVTAYLTMLGIGSPLPQPVKAINQEQWAKLAPIGSNLNQLARAANQGGFKADSQAIREARSELVAIRKALLGDLS